MKWKIATTAATLWMIMSILSLDNAAGPWPYISAAASMAAVILMISINWDSIVRNNEGR